MFMIKNSSFSAQVFQYVKEFRLEKIKVCYRAKFNCFHFPNKIRKMWIEFLFTSSAHWYLNGFFRIVLNLISRALFEFSDF